MLSIRNFYYSPDTAEALEQMEGAFGDAAATLEGQARFSLIGVLVASIRLNGPFGGLSKPKRGSYHKPTETYYTEAFADYGEWIALDWPRRTMDYAKALREAIGRVTKARLPDAEREVVLDRVARMMDVVLGLPPENIKPLKPVKLVFGPDSPRPMVSFDADGRLAEELLSVGSRVLIVPPEEAESIAAGLPKEAPREPEAFKLYRREGSVLRYHEAWAHEGEITEHWGVCGEEGETSSHAYDDLAAGGKIMGAIKRQARQAGFVTLARSKHRQLVLEIPVDGFGTEAELDTRHKIEDYLNNALGWMGLGHVDGGSTGSGSMEVFCIVPDMKIAKAAVTVGLARLGIEKARLYEMK